MAKASKVIRDEVHRVYRLSDELREQIKESRAKTGETVKVWLSAAIDQEVPKLVAELESLGLAKATGKLRPARLPLNDGLVAALKRASGQTGLPQTAIIVAAMRRRASAAAQSVKRKRRRRRARPT